MSARQRIGLVARREFIQRVRSRAFVFAAIIAFAGSLGGFVVPHYIREHRAAVHYGIAGSVPAGLPASLEALTRAGGRTARVDRVAAGDVRRALARGRLDVVIVDGARVAVRADASPIAVRAAGAAVEQARTRAALATSGAGRERLRRLAAPVAVERVGSGHHGRAADRAVAVATLVLLYLALMVGGNWISTAIVEEKASKLVEMLVPSVRPRELIAGKVIGVGAVGLCQLSAAVAGTLAGAVSQNSLHAVAASPRLFAVAVAWLLIGYAFYAAAYAAAAALVSRQEEVAAVTAPMTVIVALAYAVTVATMDDPSSKLAHVLSLTPIFAPLLMPMRVAAGSVPLWELGLSLALAAAAMAVMIRLAAVVYCGALLADGRRLGLRDALARAREDRRSALTAAAARAEA
jgi:ABC-2 type transport system permease protein